MKRVSSVSHPRERGGGAPRWRHAGGDGEPVGGCGARPPLSRSRPTNPGGRRDDRGWCSDVVLYTQWEAFLALYQKKVLIIAVPARTAFSVPGECSQSPRRLPRTSRPLAA